MPFGIQLFPPPGTILLVLALSATAAAQSAPPATSSPGAVVYSQSSASPDGIGKVYMGREIALVMGHAGADWLDRPSRETEEGTDKLVDLLRHRLKDNAVVADIGAGSGYLTFRIAPLVPRGKMVAEEIDPVMLQIIERKKTKAHAVNVETVQGTITDPKLPADKVDDVVLVDTYHEWDHPREMMAAVLHALKPGGRVFQVEYRGEDSTIQILPHHKMTVAQARKEMEAVGLHWVETWDELPQQHVIIYEKPKL